MYAAHALLEGAYVGYFYHGGRGSQVATWEIQNFVNLLGTNPLTLKRDQLVHYNIEDASSISKKLDLIAAFARRMDLVILDELSFPGDQNKVLNLFGECYKTWNASIIFTKGSGVRQLSLQIAHWVDVGVLLSRTDGAKIIVSPTSDEEILESVENRLAGEKLMGVLLLKDREKEHPRTMPLVDLRTMKRVFLAEAHHE